MAETVPLVGGQSQLFTHLMNTTPLLWIQSSERERVLKDLLFIRNEMLKRPPLLIRYSSIGVPFPIEKEDHLDGDENTFTPESALPFTAFVSALIRRRPPEGASEAVAKIFQAKNLETLSNCGVILFVDHLHYLLNTDSPDARFLWAVLPLLSPKMISIIGVSPAFETVSGGPIPEIIADHFSVINYDLPDTVMLSTVFTKAMKDWSHNINNAKKEVQEQKKEEEFDEADKEYIKRLERYCFNYTPEEKHHIVRAGQGLTLTEFLKIIGFGMRRDGKIVPELFHEAKAQAIAKSSILELVKTKETLDNIGGLEAAKSFIRQWKSCHSEEAQAFNVEPLRGIILTGIPGSGKSLFSKAISRELGLPLLRLDVGKVLGGIVGSSEERARTMIKQAESCAPAVLWIDEVEKAVSGTKSSNFTDSGVMSRVFGTLLTAMQEGLKGITIIATSNDVQSLPPEFLRRFEDVFFVGLPEEDERKEIFRIHLKKRNRDPEKFDLDRLAKESEGYTGAEIEKSVKRSLASVFSSYSGKRDIVTEDILVSLNTVTKLKTLMEKEIDALLQWARRTGARDANAKKTEQRDAEQRVRKETKASVSESLSNFRV